METVEQDLLLIASAVPEPGSSMTAGEGLAVLSMRAQGDRQAGR